MASSGPLLPHALRDPILALLLNEQKSATRLMQHAYKTNTDASAATAVTTMSGQGSGTAAVGSQPPQQQAQPYAQPRNGRQEVILFLDYDGTLAPIVSDPSQAELARGMIPILRACALASSHGLGMRIVIISGRSVSKVRNFLAPLGTRALSSLIIAGSHGYDVQWAVPREYGMQTGQEVDLPSDGYQPFAHMLPLLSKARDAVTARLLTTGATGTGMSPGAGLAAGQFAGPGVGIPGVEIEDNRYSISIHWRNTPVQHHASVEQVVRQVAQHMNGLEVRPGKMVWELRPAVQWGKGQAVQHILTRVLRVPAVQPPRDVASAARTGGALVVCIGDDHTDEDMFNTIQALCGPTAVGSSDRLQATAVPILVAQPVLEDVQGRIVDVVAGQTSTVAAEGGIHSHSARMPRQTAAQWYLQSPADVRNFLAWVVATLAEEQAEAVTQMNTADVHPMAQEPGVVQQ